MDQIQRSQSVIPIAFSKRHRHAVGIERKPEHARPFEVSPHNATPAPVAHEPLQICQFIPICLLSGLAAFVDGLGLIRVMTHDNRISTVKKTIGNSQ